ncbi:hypothetical protein [Lentzea sp.]|uniref:hypothetical protein n=1 Tax=Lentzea sp. TaxID=56099 RepID=UPI002ED25D42
MSDPSLEDRWLDVFNTAHSDPAVVGTLACPSCGEHALRLVYVVHVQEPHKAMFMFWCDSCLNGLMPNTVVVPPGGIRIEPGEEDDVPDYTLVQD